MTEIEQTNFGPGYSSQDPLSSTISQGTSGLTFQEFAGLFLVIGSVTALALFCSETPIGRKVTDKTRQFVHNCINFRSSRLNPAEDSSVAGESSDGGMEDIHESVLNNVVSPPSPQHGEVEMHEIGPSNEIPAAHNSRARTDRDGENNS